MYQLDRSHNEPEREERLLLETPTSQAVEFGRDVWMMLVAYELDQAGFVDAVAYNVPGTDNRRIELLGYDSPAECVYEFPRQYLSKHTLDDLCIDTIWFIRRAAAMRGMDYRDWELRDPETVHDSYLEEN